MAYIEGHSCALSLNLGALDIYLLRRYTGSMEPFEYDQPECTACSQCGRRIQTSLGTLIAKEQLSRLCSRCEEAGFHFHPDQEVRNGDLVAG